jgi:glycosyltransferase involved in cell wall biosynthesis
MACGTPVVASRTGGTLETVTTRAAGLLLPERSPRAIATSISALLADRPARHATRRHAEGFSWEATTQGQLALFRAIVAGSGSP